MDIYFLIIFFCLGGLVGFFAGLFGIGGGGIMVPALIFIFTKLEFPAEHIVHMALATSMASIIPSSLASLRAHHERHAVLWPIVVKIIPGIFLGTFAGTFLASYLSAKPLAIFFSIFMAAIAVQLILDRKPKPSRQLPSTLAVSGVGAGIGGASALVAIGGGTMTVPFLLWCNVALPVAIGTASAVGLPIALTGATGYLINGLHLQNLPAYTLGFIYWPAVVSMAMASFFTATTGAKLAHRLPIPLLKKYFAALQIFLSVEMLFTILGHA